MRSVISLPQRATMRVDNKGGHVEQSVTSLAQTLVITL